MAAGTRATDFRTRAILRGVSGDTSTRLKANNALDFDDLILKTLELLAEHPPVLEYYRDSFRYILVDEYQDTNLAQYELVRLLTGERRNLCVVGDDDQSIYGWRGADIRNILEFEKDFPGRAQVIKLEQNYRSTGNILDAANQVIAHNQGRKEKALWTEAGEGEKPITLYHALDERDEAAYIAAMARSRQATGTRAGQRSRCFTAPTPSRACWKKPSSAAGMPYRVYGGLKFYDRKEVKDLIAYMRALVNPGRRRVHPPHHQRAQARHRREHRGSAWPDYAPGATRCPCCPPRWIVENARLSAARPRTLRGDVRRADDRPDRGALFAEARRNSCDAVLDKNRLCASSYEAVKSDENDRAAGEHQRAAGRRDRISSSINPEGGVTDFLENVALVTDLDSMNETGGAMTLMTLHSAKGLEFDCVFLAGMEEDDLPHLPRACSTTTRWRRSAGCATWALPGPRKSCS